MAHDEVIDVTPIPGPNGESIYVTYPVALAYEGWFALSQHPQETLSILGLAGDAALCWWLMTDDAQKPKPKPKQIGKKR